VISTRDLRTRRRADLAAAAIEAHAPSARWRKQTRGTARGAPFDGTVLRKDAEVGGSWPRRRREAG
jgi:hypothetical protein